MLSSANKLLSQLADSMSVHDNRMQHRKYGDNDEADAAVEIVQDQGKREDDRRRNNIRPAVWDFGVFL